MTENFIGFLIRFRWLLAVLSVCLTVLSFKGFDYFEFDASPRSYFEEGYPYYERFESMEARYGRDFRVFFMVNASEDDLFSPRVLQAVEDLTENAWLLPYATRVDSLTNFQYTHSEEDDLIVEPLFEKPLDASQEFIKQRKSIALNDESIVNQLVSANGKHAAITATIGIDPEKQRQQEAELVEAAYILADKIRQAYPEITINLTGNLLSNYHNVKIAVRDISLMIPVMFGLMFVMLGLLMRTISGVLIAFAVAIMSSLAAIGYGAWAGITFSTLAMNAVMISITVSIAHCIHIFSHFFHVFAYKEKQEALVESLRVNFLPVSITSLTTALGFLSLNFNDLPPAAALGNTAAIGAFLAWLFAMTVLPALVLLFPFKKRVRDEGFVETMMLKIAEIVIRYKTFLALAMIAFTLFMTYLSFQNVINDRFSEMIKEPHVFRADTSAIDEHFGGLYTISYDLDSGEEYGIANPEYLQHLDGFVQWLRQQPEIAAVSSVADIFKRLNKNMHGDDPAYYRVPDSRELAAQYLLLYEMSLPFGLDLNNQITLDKRRSKVMVTFPSTDTHKIIALEERILDWQAANLPESMRNAGGAMSITWAHLARDSLIHSIEGSFIALVLISMVLLLVLRSVKYGLLSLIPNILPAVIGFGVWYVVDGEVGLGLTCVIIITIGIVVDDTVHFLSKYQKARKDNGGDTEEAIRYAFRHVGSALWITTLVLMSGFLVLTLSKLIANSALGGVTALILFAALILDFLLLPSLLLMFDKSSKKDGGEASISA